MPGHRCGRRHSLRPCDCGPRATRECAWGTALPAVGPEFVACTILLWLHDACIETALIDPGKPWQNGADESFNGKFRDEFLTLQWFRNRVDAKVWIEQWRHHYNEIRPHSSLGYLTPLEFKATDAAHLTEGRSPARADHEDQDQGQGDTLLTGAVLQ